MSKNSSKKNYQSLIEWLPTLNKGRIEIIKSEGKISRIDYYKEKGVR